MVVFESLVADGDVHSLVDVHLRTDIRGGFFFFQYRWGVLLSGCQLEKHLCMRGSNFTLVFRWIKQMFAALVS